MFDVSAVLASGVFSELDIEFATRAAARVGTEEPLALLAAALASQQARHGHVFADLRQFDAVPVVDAEGNPIARLTWPSRDQWLSSLRDSPLLSGGQERRPLVLGPDGELYLYRHFRDEQELARQLEVRLLEQDAADAPATDDLNRLFPAGDQAQRAAVERALGRQLTLIVGGPGTGKTFTVVKLMAVLAAAARRRGQRLRMLLLAPTGKAAARLSDSIAKLKPGLPFDRSVVEALPDQAQTIHRALGVMSGRARFAHDAARPLLADLVLVDEASMVDLALMRRLVDAVPLSAKLVLMGDRHQLASVEAGAVLGDLCRAERVSRAAVVELTKSYRFEIDSGIAALAAAVREGDTARVGAVLEPGRHADLELVEWSPDSGLPRPIASELRRWYRAVLEAGTAAAALERLNGFRLLCAHRRGPFGVEHLNEVVVRELSQAGMVETGADSYFGRPVLITENDYALRLFNGDVGLTWHSHAGLRVMFPEAEGKVRELSPARLPPHETVFALSVHKSQGSEFDHVVVVLPDVTSPLLTRELVYTAITRARRRVVLLGSREALFAATARPVARSTGLQRLLS